MWVDGHESVRGCVYERTCAEKDLCEGGRDVGVRVCVRESVGACSCVRMWF